jgi:hypothetical protein
MAKQAKVWDGSQWVDVLSSTSKAVYYQANEPTIANEGDIWVDSDDEILGSTGAPGANGSAATVAVGTVTTGSAGSSASVTNAGTSSAAVLNFTIPRGDTGATGATGATGPAGTPVYTLTQNQQTGTSYTLVLSDADKLIETNNASANTVTVPLNSSVAFPTGQQIHILQTGTGRTQVVAASGVTINSNVGLYLRGQWSMATLIKRDTNTWLLVGDITA